MQTYNPQRILENAKFVWWESAGPGASLPQGLSAIPFQFSLYLLQMAGFSPVAMQAILFFVLLTLMGFGMYLFTSSFFPDSRKYPLIAGLFYMFNPYMMIQVWHRFIHTTIILAAALPFLAIFWNKWIQEGKAKHLLFFLITTFLSVYAFGTYAFILAVWIFLFLLTVIAMIPWQGRGRAAKVGLRFLFAFIVWILINTWWMIPVSQISPAVLSEQHKTEESLMTLITISAQEILPYSLQLVNPFYLINQADFGNLYKNPLFELIPWVFIFVIFLGVINSMKQRTFALYGIFYLLALFLAKGAAPPFGKLFIFAFTNIFALGVLRNPFEKTGLILVFFSTVMFALGLKILSEKFVRSNKLLVAAIVFLLFVFSWPMILGKVIGRVDAPAFVEVPESYKEADQWFLEQRKTGILDGKILHLPLTGEESIQYNWKWGYNGLEPSDTFFTAYPSISRGFNIQRIDDALSGLAASFQEEVKSEIILGYLQDFNVRFIVLHKDVNQAGGNLANPEDIEQLLNNLDFLERQPQFQDLVIFKLKDQYFSPRITIEHNIDLLYPGKEKLSLWTALVKDPTTKYISLVNNKDLEVPEISGYNQTFIFPKGSFLYGISSDSVSPLERLKSSGPFFNQTGMIQSLNLSEKILALSATLLSISTNPSGDISSLMDDYDKQLMQILPRGIEINRFQISGQESLLSGIFRIHLNTLQVLIQQPSFNESNRQKISEVKEKLEKYLVNLNIAPKYNNQTAEERQVFKFQLPVKSNYELLMVKPETASLFPDKLEKKEFFIENDRTVLNASASQNTMNFGMLDLEAGEFEVSYPVVFSGNLASATTYTLESPYIEVPLANIRPSGAYRFSGQVRVQGDSGFYILLYENQNPQPSLKEFLQANPLAGWQTFQLNFESKPTTKSAKLVIAGAQNSLQSKVFFNDIKVQEVLRNTVFLKGSRGESVPEPTGESVRFSRLSPVSFKGEMQILSPGFLFFKETFHPGWKLTLKNKDESKVMQKHFLGNLYANAWYIDQAGEYEFKMDFEPQRYVSLGVLLTGVGFAAIAGYWLLGKNLKVKK